MRDLQKYNRHPGFRKYQKETINKVLDIIEKGEKHNIVIQSPVGSGKSNIGYVTAAYLSGEDPTWRNFLMSSQNMLLDQYTDEFSDVMAVIKGGDNYPCSVNQKTYPEGLCHSINTKKSDLPCYWGCEYVQARQKAREHSLTLSNFHYFLLEFDFVKQMKKRNLAIFDEAHNIEGIMMDYRSVTISAQLIKKCNDLLNEFKTGKSEFWTFCRKSMADYEEELQHFNVEDYSKLLTDENIAHNTRVFKEEIFPVFLKYLNGIIGTVESALKRKLSDIKDYAHDMNETEYEMEKSGFGKARKIITDLERVRCKFSNFKKDIEKTEWIVDIELDKMKNPCGILVKPVKVGFLTQDALLQMADFRIFMSATVCGYERFCENIGLDLNDTVYIEVPSTFPVENRPFFYEPIAKMNYQNMQSNLKNIVKFIDDIMEKNQTKGIVHCVSYNNMNFIKNNSRYSSRLLIHDSTNKNQVLKQFYASKDKVLVSPSSQEGLNLQDDLSRWQVLIKVPYLSLGDKQIKRRMEIDSDWYAYQAVLAIIQSTGRSCRSEIDWCKTYMLDGNFERLYEFNEELFTSDFKESIVWPD